MKNYRMNAVLAGAFYFFGTVMGIFAIVVAGQSSAGDVSVNLGAAPSRLTLGAFFIMLMGVLLSAMTVFLYPLFRKDSKELALGMVLFRGALEGAGYIIAALLWVLLAALSKEFSGTDSATLHTVGNLVLEVSNKNGDIQTVFFIIGSICLYTSFYRTRLIPRWLTVWGLIGAAGIIAYALLHFFHLDNGIGFWLQMIIFPQELVMGAWLVIRGFNQDAVKKLDEPPHS